MFDFRKFHVRSINAETETEKAAINQELKDIYAGLDEEDKSKFNQELQAFLISQYKNLNDQVGAIKAQDGVN